LDRRKEDLKYNSLEALSICASFLITFGMIGWGLKLTAPQNPEYRAKWQSRVLGYSLWQIKLNKEARLNQGRDSITKKAGGRNLASIGSENSDERGNIGIDPWGQPYLYEIKNNKHLLFIWSKGPNSKNDSSNNLIGFKDDDIGYVIDLKMRR